MPPAPLEGRHALVTGAGRGIGEAIAARLAAEGARVTLLSRTRDEIQAVAASLGDAAQALPADVTDAEETRRAFERAAESFGPVDILINNAGQARSGLLHKAPDELWHAMLAVNLTGTYHGIRAALPGMLERRFGRIVNIASTAGIKGYTYVSAYVAAKHALVGFTRALALETVKDGVTVNAVCPGFTDTDMVARAVAAIAAASGRSPRDAREKLASGNPAGRLVRPEEVAEAVAFLCRPDAGAMTGQTIAVACGEV